MQNYLRVGIGMTMVFILGLAACQNNNTTTPTSPITNPIPEGAIWYQETLRRIHPPAGFTTVLGWLQAATLSKTQVGETARVVIDYMQLIEQDANFNERVLFEDHYNESVPRPMSIAEGGLYDRSPYWFATDDHTPVYNSEIRDGFLTIDVSTTPNNIVHWWTDRVYSQPTSRYFLQLRVKIEGKVGLQLGSDYWVDLTSPWNGYDDNCVGVNNCEAWISDWYGDSGGDFITIRAPLN